MPASPPRCCSHGVRAMSSARPARPLLVTLPSARPAGRWPRRRIRASTSTGVLVRCGYTEVAQFIAVCSASRLAEELRISAPFSSQSHANREAALRHTCKRLCQLQPTTNCHKLSERGYLHFWNTTHEYYTTRCNCRSRIWWAGSGRAIGPRPCRGDFNRPAQLPYFPTLALSGCDVFAKRRRHRCACAQPVSASGERHLSDGDGDRRRCAGPYNPIRGWQPDLLRLPRAGRGNDCQLFQHSGGSRACVSTLNTHTC